MARSKLFLAVDVGSDIRNYAVLMQQTLAKTGAAVKWVEPHNLHVTLNFLGDVDDRDMHTVCRAVTAVAANEPGFALSIAGIGAFPTVRRPKTIWGGIAEGNDSLKRLYDTLEPKFLALGLYRKEERGYTPHLTLGRGKDESEEGLLAAEIAKHATWHGGEEFIDEVMIYSSELTRDGPVYALVGRGKLGG